MRRLAAGRGDVTVYEGDCNTVLLENVFPHCRYEDFRRALCLPDPYDLNPRWEVVATAGQMKGVEIFLNFMIMAPKTRSRKKPVKVINHCGEEVLRVCLNSNRGRPRGCRDGGPGRSWGLPPQEQRRALQDDSAQNTPRHELRRREGGWRRGRDSNPRFGMVPEHAVSNRAPSASRTPLRPYVKQGPSGCQRFAPGGAHVIVG